MCCQAGLANGNLDLIGACDTSGTLPEDCLPCKINAASTKELTLQIITATNDDLINIYLNELLHLDNSISIIEILDVGCPEDGVLAATGFRDP